jgi:hypothetical protein
MTTRPSWFYVSVKRDVRAVACVKVGVVFERGDESGCSVQRGRRGGAVDCAGAGGLGGEGGKRGRKGCAEAASNQGVGRGWVLPCAAMSIDNVEGY